MEKYKSHSCCWEQKQPSACGLKGEHIRCCLCEERNPKKNDIKPLEWKKRKDVSIREDVMKKAEHIVDEFKQFTDGYRVMILMHRAKEGGANREKMRSKKVIVKNIDEYNEALYDLLLEKEKSPFPLRIYCHVNSRSIEHGIRHFKQEQLEADYYDKESKNYFYEDIRNRFISCLSMPRARDTAYFVIDLDTRDTSELLVKIDELNIEVIKQYPTKNGWHFITKAFNPNLLVVDKCEVHRDGLILLSF